MTPFGQKLSDEQAAALLTFVRNSWGNAAPTVDAEGHRPPAVLTIRTEFSRAKSWCFQAH